MKTTLSVAMLLGTAVAALLLALSVEPSAAQQSATYTGPDTCKACHYKEHKYWKKSGLAKSMEALKPTAESDKELFDRKKASGLDPAKDYSADATCLKCHTTGYGQPGGYPATVSAENQELADLMGSVSCEACHGPGSLYAKHKTDTLKTNEDAKFTFDGLKPMGLVQPNEANCKGCHNEENPGNATDTHDFEKDKGRVHSKPPKKKKD